MADAALVFSDERQVLLTVSANNELYYSRRLELPAGLFSSADLSNATPQLSTPRDFEADPLAQRFVTELQRSLDALRRTWSFIRLDGMRVYAAERSADVSTWLGQQLGLRVDSLNVNALFPGFDGIASAQQASCLPLLGVLLRTESRAL